ncbi:MAG: hypothetical protein QM539_04455 [Alphaproteobacteria bacterium]|nr:hypothetical protein [Alphaproteobacteria bacterium]
MPKLALVINLVFISYMSFGQHNNPLNLPQKIIIINQQDSFVATDSKIDSNILYINVNITNNYLKSENGSCYYIKSFFSWLLIILPIVAILLGIILLIFAIIIFINKKIDAIAVYLEKSIKKVNEEEPIDNNNPKPKCYKFWKCMFCIVNYFNYPPKQNEK